MEIKENDDFEKQNKKKVITIIVSSTIQMSWGYQAYNSDSTKNLK